MQRFFVEPYQVLEEEHRITLTGPDLNHMKNVLRMRIGEDVWISDGSEKEYHCTIEEFQEDSAVLHILYAQESQYELPSRIYLFQGLPKGDKMELIIQKAVELGAYAVVPVETRRCVVKLDAKKAQKKVTRWQQISESAAKQSKRMLIPEVKNVMNWKEALAFAKGLDVVLIPYELAQGMKETREILAAIQPGQSVGIFIGPEGGFEEEEVRDAMEAGGKPVTLGYPDAKGLYLALRTGGGVFGVIGIDLSEKPLDAFENSVLLSILGEGALAIENRRNALEKEQAALQARNEELRANLLRTISHDLRTPLTSISGNASNLLSNGETLDTETRNKICTDIFDDAQWLIGLVENLLSITRIEDGRMNLQISPQLMDEMIEEALHHVNRKSCEHTITTQYGDEILLVNVDARLIMQVVVNLVDNAIKYTPVGSVIQISAYRKDHQVVVEVADNGPGIPDRAKAQVFEMFYTGQSRIADSHRSLGLGLPLCRAILTAHGGTLTLRDNIPNGSVFSFALPQSEVNIHE